MNVTDLPSKMQTKVREEYGCWIWTAATNNRGYGSVSISKNGTKLAHRYAYETVRGPIPAGLTIDHLCARKQCVNPWHMEPVTVSENAKRGDHGLTEPKPFLGHRLSYAYVNEHLTWRCDRKSIDHYPDLKDPEGWAAMATALERLGRLLAPALERTSP